MLNRQKTRLYLSKHAQRTVSRLEITKWCFLLSKETPSGGGKAFYQFLPYKYGPFSNCLYREVDALASQEWIDAPNEKSWRWSRQRNDITPTLPPGVAADARAIIRRFHSVSVNKLIDYVYQSYPEFTVNSLRNPMASRPLSQPATYTAGYQGLSIDGFLNRLIQSAIERIIDVRNHPVARSFGFHKSTIHRLASSVDIEYLHIPQLGIPSENRQNLDSRAAYKRLFATYEATTLKEEKEAIAQVAVLMTEKPSVLICLEADPDSCRRTHLARAVEKLTGLPIIDLGGDPHG